MPRRNWFADACRRLSHGSPGSAAIELAVALPMLCLILVGTADFGRVFAESIAVQNASRMGVQYAIVNLSNATPDYNAIQSAALAELPNATGATAAARQYCRCGNNGSENDCSSTCSSQARYVEVTVRKSFTPLISYPGIPSPVPLSSTVTVRFK